MENFRMIVNRDVFDAVYWHAPDGAIVGALFIIFLRKL